MTDFWSRIRARQTLRTAKIFEHERLEAHQVANVRLPKLQAKQKDAEQSSSENIEKTLGFLAKIERP